MEHMLTPCEMSSIRRSGKEVFLPYDSHDRHAETKTKLVKIVNTHPLHHSLTHYLQWYSIKKKTTKYIHTHTGEIQVEF